MQIIATKNPFLYPIDIDCYNDTPSRATYSNPIWDWQTTNGKQNTIKKCVCVVACASDNKSIVGVEAG